MTAIPFDQIQTASLAQAESLLSQWLPHGRRIGKEYRVGSLQGEPGDSLSINLATGKWADFAADESGHDLIDLAARMRHRGDRTAAARELGQQLGLINGTPLHGTAKRQDVWLPMIPPPADAPRPSDAQLRCDTLHEYFDADDRLLFYVRRFEAVGNDRKRFAPLTYGTLNGRTGWHDKAPSPPRPFYGINRLPGMPDAEVIVTEGEKAADAAQRLFPDRPCLSWCGGAKAVEHADASPLAGRRVIIWPDADDEGRAAGQKIAEVIRRAGGTVAGIMDTAGLPPKFDAADLEQAGADPDQWLAARFQPDGTAERIIATLDAHAWAQLDIPPTVRLLGELIVPASRTFVVGTTGVGKTLLAYEMAAGMAAGTGFLRWTCDRPSRVLVLDGEMPDALIKRRVQDILGRHAVPPGNLTIYSVGRAVQIAEAARLLPMPPLTSEEGHAWIMDLIAILKPDVVIFDNLMSLAPGNHAEPDTWLKVLPLVMEVSRAGPAQIWCDHSGWDASRQYGTSTKAWTFDTVGIIKPPPEEQRQPDALTVNLTFDAPGKARRRTPENRADFEPQTLVLRNGAWSSTGATEGRTLSAKATGWLRDIAAIFDIPEVAERRTVNILGKSCVRVAISRAQLRDWLRKCGRIGDGTNANLTDAERVKLHGWLNTLREAGKIGIDGEYLWLA